MVEIVAWARDNVLSALVLAAVAITVVVLAFKERQGHWRK